MREDYYVTHFDNGDEVPVDKWSEFYEDHLECEMTTERSEEAYANSKAAAKEEHATASRGGQHAGCVGHTLIVVDLNVL